MHRTVITFIVLEVPRAREIIIICIGVLSFSQSVRGHEMCSWPGTRALCRQPCAKTLCRVTLCRVTLCRGTLCPPSRPRHKVAQGRGISRATICVYKREETPPPIFWGRLFETISGYFPNPAIPPYNIRTLHFVEYRLCR